jgi:hypothetical protein
MFNGVEMHVIHVGEVVFVVADDVLPISTLPDSPFVSRQLRRSSKFRGGNGSRKHAFDQPPTFCVVGVTWREFHYAMKMFRQNHPCVDMKGVALPNGRNGMSESFNMLGQKLISMSF